MAIDHSDLEPASARTLTQDVIRRLREFVEDPSRARGSRLPSERQLAAMLKVSRTVLREAVSALRAEGQIESRRGAGLFIPTAPGFNPLHLASVKTQPHAVVDLLELRAGVEIQAARYAAMRRTEDDLRQINSALERMLTLPPGDPMGAAADYDFHLAVAAAAHNPEFLRFLTFIGQTLIPRQAMRLQADRFAAQTGYVAMIRREHTAIAEAIGLRDARGAMAAMDTHLTDSADRYRQWANEVAGERPERSPQAASINRTGGN